MNNIPPKLKEYLDESRAPLPPITSPEEPLRLDSLGLIRLVGFMESELGIRIEDDELLVENFETLGALDRLIATKASITDQA
jgi:acyl carrier protein